MSHYLLPVKITGAVFQLSKHEQIKLIGYPATRGFALGSQKHSPVF
jgi:hypothetical protein